MKNKLVDSDPKIRTNNIASTQHGIILILAAVMPAMAIISLVPVLPLLLQEFASVKGYEFLVPIAMTVPALCVALFSPLAGWISDKAGRKSVLLYALLIYAAIGLLPYFLSELSHIIAARVVLGIAEAAIMTVATALIADYFKGKARERWVAIQIASVSLSAIVLIAIGGLLGEFLGSRGPFLLYLLALPIALFVWLVLFEPERNVVHTDSRAPSLPWLKILPLLFTTLFVGIIFYTVIVKLGEILALTTTVTPAIIGGIGAGANIGVALGSFIFKRFKGASGPTLISIGLMLAAVGYCGAALSGNLVLSSISVIVACLGFGTLLPTMLTWVLKELPENVRGRGTGLWTGCFFLGQFAAPIVVAALQGQMGGLDKVLMLIAALSLVGAFVAVVKIKGAQGLVSH
ncbi:MFS transporter [Paraglaciecola hydrolytica]|uniref:MFS transporter n=1 Tax=Paraglaciecola hydrolytica TaxID=1799789 RepID=A0A148KKB6_9ALTE|nr:MFS transporter [Paraglaciecola hydrolytica]KXI26743.1 MFS transporter [Paraglaciecola hydrolytica]